MKSARMMEPTTRGLPIAIALVIAEIIFLKRRSIFCIAHVTRNGKTLKDEKKKEKKKITTGSK